MNDPYFPFRPDLWWPDLFEPLSPAEREELIEGLAVEDRKSTRLNSSHLR